MILPPKNGRLKAWLHGVRKANYKLLIFSPGQGHFLTFGTFTSSHNMGHLRILEQGQIQISTGLARGGGESGFTLTHALINSKLCSMYCVSQSQLFY